MRLADADRPHEEQAAIHAGIVILDEPLRFAEGAPDEAVAFDVVEVLERAVRVTARDARGGDEVRLRVSRAARATARALAGHYFESRAEAERTDGGSFARGLGGRRLIGEVWKKLRRRLPFGHGKQRWNLFRVVQRHPRNLSLVNCCLSPRGGGASIAAFLLKQKIFASRERRADYSASNLDCKTICDDDGFPQVEKAGGC